MLHTKTTEKMSICYICNKPLGAHSDREIDVCIAKLIGVKFKQGSHALWKWYLVDEDGFSDEYLPFYSTDMNAAMELWLDDSWELHRVCGVWRIYTADIRRQSQRELAKAENPALAICHARLQKGKEANETGR